MQCIVCSVSLSLSSHFQCCAVSLSPIFLSLPMLCSANAVLSLSHFQCCAVYLSPFPLTSNAVQCISLPFLSLPMLCISLSLCSHFQCCAVHLSLLSSHFQCCAVPLTLSPFSSHFQCCAVCISLSSHFPLTLTSMLCSASALSPLSCCALLQCCAVLCNAVHLSLSKNCRNRYYIGKSLI